MIDWIEQCDFVFYLILLMGWIWLLADTIKRKDDD